MHYEVDLTNNNIYTATDVDEWIVSPEGVLTFWDNDGEHIATFPAGSWLCLAQVFYTDDATV